MPRGLRDAGAYALGYRVAGARLPRCSSPTATRTADPHALLAQLEPPPLHPVRLEGDSDDLRRSRLTVFFRLPLRSRSSSGSCSGRSLRSSPCSCQWFVTLFRGPPGGAAPPVPRARTSGFGSTSAPSSSLAANPFPGFSGAPGQLPARPRPAAPGAPEPLEDALPAVPRAPRRSSCRVGRSAVLIVAAILTWFAALFHGPGARGPAQPLRVRAPLHSARSNAYFYLAHRRLPAREPARGRRAG